VVRALAAGAPEEACCRQGGGGWRMGVETGEQERRNNGAERSTGGQTDLKSNGGEGGGNTRVKL